MALSRALAMALPEIPEHLVAEIERGNVVAFVGAGFSHAAGLPTWQKLLSAIGEQTRDSFSANERALLRELSSSSLAHDLDMAAQLLRDKLGEVRFRDGVAQQLAVPKMPPAMAERLRLLLGLPLCGIVTTNFDGLLGGTPVDSPEFPPLARRILRETPSSFERMQALAFQLRNSQTPTVLLHGSVGHRDSLLVCSRESYRQLLYGSTQYATFVRTLLATRTILFLGFSFTDNYLNELRSEVLGLFRHKGVASHDQDGSPQEAPLAYAVMADVSPEKADALRRHEGLQVLSYSSRGGKDFSGFDKLLRALFVKTNPTVRMGKLFSEQRKLIWFHPSWSTSRDTRFLAEYLQQASKDAAAQQLVSKPGETLSTDSVSQTLESVAKLGAFVVAIVAVFDPAHPEYHDGRHVFELLAKIQELPVRPPVLVFGAERRGTRRAVVRAGALCYESYYYKLLEHLSALFELELEHS